MSFLCHFFLGHPYSASSRTIYIRFWCIAWRSFCRWLLQEKKSIKIDTLSHFISTFCSSSFLDNTRPSMKTHLTILSLKTRVIQAFYFGRQSKEEVSVKVSIQVSRRSITKNSRYDYVCHCFLITLSSSAWAMPLTLSIISNDSRLFNSFMWIRRHASVFSLK